jgi:tRNA pseudouridine55 synthase
MARKQENRIVNDHAVIIWKEVGETPLEALERFRAEEISRGRVELANVPMTYAGRLDPMAEGELLILMGEECKKKEKYLGLDKEYIVEVIFGIETDTYDALGIATSKMGGQFEKGAARAGDMLESISEEVTKKVVTLLECQKFAQTYPPYSARTVNGRQLHELARAGELPEEMPHKMVTLYSSKVLSKRYIGAQDLLKEITQKILLVRGDFRQGEIIKRWETLLADSTQRFPVLEISVTCSSGTYMRSLAHELGKGFGGACALSIKRTKLIFDNDTNIDIAQL